MDLQKLIFSNCILSLIVNVGNIYNLQLLINKKIKIVKIILPALIYLILTSTIYSFLTLKDIQETGYIRGTTYIFIIIISYIIDITFAQIFFPNIKKTKLFAAITISGSLLAIFPFVGVILFDDYSAPIWDSIFIPSYIIDGMITTLFSMITMFLISKTKVLHYFRSVLNSPVISVVFGVIYILADSGLYYYLSISRISEAWADITIIGVWIGYLVLGVLFGFLSRDKFNSQKIQESETVILQQQNYVNQLEAIQQELRMVQHD